MPSYDFLKPKDWAAVLSGKRGLTKRQKLFFAKRRKEVEGFFRNNSISEALLKEMRGRLQEEEWGVPSFYKNHVYRIRYDKGKEHPLFTRAPRQNPEDRKVILDGNLLSSDSGYFRLLGIAPSQDERLLAYVIDRDGSESGTLFLKNIGGNVRKIAEHVSGSLAWGKKCLYYVQLDARNHPHRVHVFYPETSHDHLVYEEMDPAYSVAVATSSDERFVFLELHDHERTEIHTILPGTEQTQLLWSRRKNKSADADHRENSFYLLTNWRAKDFQILRLYDDQRRTADGNVWQSFVPPKTGTLYLEAAYHEHFVALLKRTKGAEDIDIVDYNAPESLRSLPVNIEEEAFDLHLDDRFDYVSDSFSYAISSPIRPPEWRAHDVRLQKDSVLKTKIIPNYERTYYTTKKLWVRSFDGIRIPLTITYRKDRTSPGPCLLYGYGAYGISTEDDFSSANVSLMDRGFVVATAHVRGGMEMGHHWYTQGKKFRKHHTFLDFIACGDFLIRKGYTRPDALSAMGGSAGGMIMGYIANNAYALFKAIVAFVPFVDCLSTMQDPKLPLTPPEWEEWGNPIKNPESYAYIKSYSPVDNVTPHSYPAIYATCGLLDPRVGFWEPAKWIGKIQAKKTNDSPALLSFLEEGHGGKTGRYRGMEEIAKAYAFLISILQG